MMLTPSIPIAFSVQGRQQVVCHKIPVTVDFPLMSSLTGTPHHLRVKESESV